MKEGIERADGERVENEEEVKGREAGLKEVKRKEAEGKKEEAETLDRGREAE